MELAELTDDDLSLEIVSRLRSDVKEASESLTIHQSRWLADEYCLLQENRKRAALQARSREGQEPNRVVSWLQQQNAALERMIKTCLGHFAAQYRVGAWLQSLHGVGPVISAAMLANFDIRRAPTYGHFWSYSGLVPSISWLGVDGAKELLNRKMPGKKVLDDLDLIVLGTETHRDWKNILNMAKAFAERYQSNPYDRVFIQKALAMRPWNERVKSLVVFRFGETQIKFCNSEKSYYGRLYAARKARIIADNESGKFADDAKEGAERVGKSTDAYKSYSVGKLPPAHVHARARRWMVKLFLSHLHAMMYRDFHGTEPPIPYPMDKLSEDHRHYLECPGGKIEDYQGKRIRELLE